MLNSKDLLTQGYQLFASPDGLKKRRRARAGGRRGRHPRGVVRSGSIRQVVPLAPGRVLHLGPGLPLPLYADVRRGGEGPSAGPRGAVARRRRHRPVFFPDARRVHRPVLPRPPARHPRRPPTKLSPVARLDLEQPFALPRLLLGAADLRFAGGGFARGGRVRLFLANIFTDLRQLPPRGFRPPGLIFRLILRGASAARRRLAVGACGRGLFRARARELARVLVSLFFRGPAASRGGRNDRGGQERRPGRGRARGRGAHRLSSPRPPREGLPGVAILRARLCRRLGRARCVATPAQMVATASRARGPLRRRLRPGAALRRGGRILAHLLDDILQNPLPRRKAGGPDGVASCRAGNMGRPGELAVAYGRSRAPGCAARGRGRAFS